MDGSPAPPNRKRNLLSDSPGNEDSNKLFSAANIANPKLMLTALENYLMSLPVSEDPVVVSSQMMLYTCYCTIRSMLDGQTKQNQVSDHDSRS